MNDETSRDSTDEPLGGDPPCWQHLLDEEGRIGPSAADVERMRQYMLGPNPGPQAGEA
jgi:hypothetical protein